MAAATAGHSGQQRQQRDAGAAASGDEARRRVREQTREAVPPQRTREAASGQQPVDGSGHGADGTDGALVLSGRQLRPGTASLQIPLAYIT